MGSLFKGKEKNVNIDEAMLQGVENKTVMVTGGAGFVGAEFCRQIAKMGPSQLIIFDLNEEKLFGISKEIKSDFSELNLVSLLGSTSDIDRINEVFKQYKPEVVIHAATYKNEELLENSPGEAVKNNILGTYNVAHAAKQSKSTSFTFISTYLAADPSNVMRSSMRIAEMLVSGANHYADETTCFVYRMGEDMHLSLMDFPKMTGIDDFIFKLQSLVIAARTNDDNKTKDYIRQVLK